MAIISIRLEILKIQESIKAKNDLKSQTYN